MKSDACAVCGRSLDIHGPENEQHRRACPGRGAKTFYATLNLPVGMSCADCWHLNRCVSLFGVEPTNETCDFYPIMFRPVEL
jgi:hypothetical protein